MKKIFILGFIFVIIFISCVSRNDFYKAVMAGDRDTVRELIKKGANLNRFKTDGEDYETYLAVASNLGHIGVAEELILAGMDVNEKGCEGFTPLMHSVGKTKEKKELLKMLIDKGADVNIKSYAGHTALTLASQYGEYEIAEILIDKGADINAKGEYGRTPLINTMRENEEKHALIAKMLIDKNANLDLQDNHGYTALMWAVEEKRQIETAKILIEKNADVNIKNDEGQTALMLASEEGLLEIVDMLVNKNADVYVKDIEGRTAIDYVAYNNNRDDIIKILKNANVKK